MDDYRRGFLQSMLLVSLGSVLTGGVELDEGNEDDNQTSSMLGPVFVTDSYASLEREQPTPDQYALGLTGSDGVFAGLGGSWMKIDDQTPEFESLEAAQASIGTKAGPSGHFDTRELISESDQTVKVPEDVGTIQAALDSVPLFNRHHYTVDIAAGAYDENIVVPSVVSAGIANTDDGRNASVTLKSRGTATVRSVTVLNPVGCTAVGIQDLNPTQTNPYSDERASVAVYGGQGQTYLNNITFDSVVDNQAQGIMAYGGAMVRADDCSFGSGNMRVGFHAKSQGRILALGATGEVTDYPYSVSGGSITYANSEMSGGLDQTETLLGMIYDGDTKTLHGVSNIAE